MECKFRKNISFGITLQSVDEGEVFITSHSARPIVVESNYLDREAMRSSDETLHTVCQRASIKVRFECMNFRI